MIHYAPGLLVKSSAHGSRVPKTNRPRQSTLMPDTRSKATRARSGVFISYARGDGEAFAARLRARLEGKGIGLWQDRIEMEGGRDWWLQITEALEAVEFMALVMTPSALRSETVRREWRYARQQGVCVYPIKGAADLDFESLPRWMRDAHFYDLGQLDGERDGPEWRKFVNDLNTRCQTRRVPFMVEDLPDDFVPRPAELERLLGHLLDRERAETVGITAALRGAGGYGKTTLARAVCHDERVLEAFDEGVLWVTLGQTPGDLTGRVEDLIYTLTEERPGFSDINAATARLVELLADRDMLLVIDDVWNGAHLRPFTQSGPRCARLITTRDLDTLPANTQRVDVDAMRREEAVALLGAGLPAGGEGGLRALAARLGEWPLLLTLVNGALRKRVGAGQALADAVAYVNTALDKRGLTFFDARDAEARGQAVAKTLAVSFDHLNETERARHGELAVFPEDADIPLATLEKFWGATGGLDEFDTEELCDRLNRLSLLLRFDPTTRLIRLHDVIRTYLIQEQGGNLPALHARLLDASRPVGASWADMPLGEPYFWDYLAYHLKEAGRGDELLATAKDLRYVTAKTFVRKTPAAESDLLAAEELYPDDAVLRTLRRHFLQTGHLLSRCETLDDLKSNFYCRLLHLDELAGLTQDLAGVLSAPYVVPLHPLPDSPRPELARAFGGHGLWVNDCAFSPDGSFLVAAFWDGILEVWDVKSGKQSRTLEGHAGDVNGCAVSPDGSTIASASADGTVKVWDARSGRELLTLRGHAGSVGDCAYSPDGSLIVSASIDCLLKGWDAKTGAERLTLTGHTYAVAACAFSPDGSSVVSASGDATLKVWDAGSGKRLFDLTGHDGWVNACAFSPDGSFILSGGNDCLLKVWDAKTGRHLFDLEGHDDWVNGCAFSPDGSLVVSASRDGTVRVWLLEDRKQLATFVGHAGYIQACAFSPDGSVVASAAWDGTVKLWEVKATGEAQPALSPPEQAVRCAVSPDDSFVAYVAGGTLKVRDVGSGSDLDILDGVNCCAVSPDGAFIVATLSNRGVKILEARGGGERLTIEGDNVWGDGCAVSPDGALVAFVETKTLQVRDAANGREVHTLAGHADAVHDCAFSPDGSFLVSASWDKTLKVWDVREGKERFTLTGHEEYVHRCAVSSDGAFIVSASYDNTAKVWDAKDGRELRALTGHTEWLLGCAISPDDSLVATASRDGELKLWEMQTGKCLFTFQTEGVLLDCKFFSDGRRLAAAGGSGLYLLRVVR